MVAHEGKVFTIGAVPLNVIFGPAKIMTVPKHKKIIYRLYGFIAGLICLAFCGCSNDQSSQKKITRSFYYWKSVFDLTGFEKEKLSALKVQTIYLRFFDVDWDETSRRALPKASVRFIDTTTLKNPLLKIIPTVFITTACLQQTPDSSMKDLAHQLVGLVNKIVAANGLSTYDELQIDCDWTANYKDKYFNLLKHIKAASGKILSATIRLHQIKYTTSSGIPPVDRGLLMCYNMGNLKNPATDNSIIDEKELQQYIGNLSAYPLQLDVALPLFDWYVFFRSGGYKGIIDQLPSTVFSDNWSTKKGCRYQVIKDTMIAGYDLHKGDFLRYEKSDYNTILATAKIISKKLPTTNFKLSLFHLDSITLSKYNNDELENIYNSMH